jgi:hypothetical protein
MPCDGRLCVYADAICLYSADNTALARAVRLAARDECRRSVELRRESRELTETERAGFALRMPPDQRLTRLPNGSTKLAC